MKLLSRFIWLIAGILIIVATGIAFFQIKAEKEFEQIKSSITEEYDVQVDKMLAIDPHSIGEFSSWMSEMTNATATRLFIESEGNEPDILQEYLFDDILIYHHVDAVWLLNSEGELLLFETPRALDIQNMPIPANELSEWLKPGKTHSFYAKYNNEVYYFHGTKIESRSNNGGYLVMASVLDNRWIDKYMASINNSSISIESADHPLSEISDKTLRITRELKTYDQQIAAILNIELNLPFLALWEQTNSNDKWIMTASLAIVVLFLLVFLVLWVISPLKKISASLKKQSSDEITSLASGKTEMNEVARMITDYYQKNDELEASESVKRYIIEEAQVGIIICDAKNGIINTTNPYACRLTGLPEEAIIGNTIGSFLPETETDNRIKENFESVLTGNNNKRPILLTQTKMMMSGTPVIMYTFVDLSEIKHLKDKLQEEKKKLSLAVENSGLIFCEYNFETDDIVIDQSLDFITKGKNNHIGKNIIDNIYDNDRKQIIEKFEIIDYGKKDALTVEFRIKHPSRGLIWFNVSILITSRNDHGKPIQLIGLVEDITERINIQQELIKAKEKAEESDRMKSSYLGNMSHKIRTPLNTIVGFANLLTEEDLEAEQKNNFINIIRNDTESVLRLIDDMINLAKIDANQLDVHNKQNSLNKIMGNVADYFKANEKTNNFKFTLNTMLPDGKDTINTDPAQLEKALMNLLNNAFKFTREGEIELGYFVNPADNKLIIYVKDTGIGIPDSQKDKIFNRFYQVDPMSEGTGLGLTITESIVKMLGGKITFESEENKGSKFFIELPMNQA